MLKGDYVSIAATSTGVSGTISVPDGARLVGLNVSMKTADGGIISGIEIKGTGLPQPLKYVFPHTFVSITTNMCALAIGKTPTIKLDIPIRGTNTVTIVVTTTANETVVCGLMWQ
jgi:hypothetical protein